MNRKGQEDGGALGTVGKYVLMTALILILVLIIALKWKEMVLLVAKIKGILS